MMPPPKPPLTLRIPGIEQDELPIDMPPGDVLFVLGANGTGKSGLIQHIYMQCIQKDHDAQWISAQRQNWMQSSQPDMTPQGKSQMETMIRDHDQNPRSRWQHPFSSDRPQISAMRIMQKSIDHGMKIAELAKGDKIGQIKEYVENNQDPLDIVNDLFRLAHLPISLSIIDGSMIQAIQHDNPYGVAELSDGERNLLFLASDVLTAPENSLLLIDEPERHLHRSIISPVLSGLFSYRSDCTFIIATHEIMLPIDNSSAKVLLVRSCLYRGDTTEWDADLIDSASEIDESLKKDILGSRRKLLFIEGNNNSLDLALYSILFPGVSIIPKGSRRNVESSVKAIGEANGFLWVRAYGIVDGDGYSDEEKDELRDRNIYPIDVYQIESIFYDAKIQSNMFPEKLSEIEDAKRNALTAFSRSVETLAKARAFRKCRAEVLSHLPDHDEFENKDIAFRFKDVLDAEMIILRDLIRHDEYDTIVRKYPIRRAGVLDEIARKLDYRDRKAYKKEFLRRIQNDHSLLEQAKSLLGGLPEHIAQDSVHIVSDQGE